MILYETEPLAAHAVNPRATLGAQSAELGRETGWSVIAQQPGPLLDGGLIELKIISYSIALFCLTSADGKQTNSYRAFHQNQSH